MEQTTGQQKGTGQWVASRLSRVCVSQKRHPQVEDCGEEATQLEVRHVWEMRRP